MCSARPCHSALAIRSPDPEVVFKRASGGQFPAGPPAFQADLLRHRVERLAAGSGFLTVAVLTRRVVPMAEP
ncbi:MAG: hypothetical protein ACRDTT_35120, partial [Pseudonocardiaceae bacterium]